MFSKNKIYRVSGKLDINGKQKEESRILWVLNLGRREERSTNLGMGSILKTLESFGVEEGESL